MEDQGREADALSWMSSEVGPKIQQDPVPICAKDAESDCRWFTNTGPMMVGPKEDEARTIVVEAYCMSIEEDEEKNGEGEWYLDILQYLKDGTYPKSVGRGFTEDHMMEFTSFVWPSRKRRK